jgi:hypothetical protein
MSPACDRKRLGPCKVMYLSRRTLLAMLCHRLTGPVPWHEPHQARQLFTIPTCRTLQRLVTRGFRSPRQRPTRPALLLADYRDADNRGYGRLIPVWAARTAPGSDVSWSAGDQGSCFRLSACRADVALVRLLQAPTDESEAFGLLHRRKRQQQERAARQTTPCGLGSFTGRQTTRNAGCR